MTNTYQSVNNFKIGYCLGVSTTVIKHNQITFEAILISFWSLVFQFLAEFVSAAPYSHNWTTCLLNVIPIFCKELRRTISWWRRAGSCVQINWKPGLWFVDLSPGQPISDHIGLVSNWIMFPNDLPYLCFHNWHTHDPTSKVIR